MSMEQTRTGLTGLRQTDMLILQQLRDNELDPVCETSEYLKSICDDPIFWYNRIRNKLNPSIKRFNQEYPTDNIIGIEYQNTFQEIDLVKEYYGFKSLKELSSFMDQLPSLALLLIFNQIYTNTIDEIIDMTYTFDRNLLPEFIDLNKLMFYLKRETVKVRYLYTDQNSFIMTYTFLDPQAPGYRIKNVYKKEDPEVFGWFKKLGIKF